MQKADYLLRLMKQKTDDLLAYDEKLQQFLIWVNEKSLSVEVPYKLVAVRAFYFAVVVAGEVRAFSFAVARDLGLPFDHDRSGDIALVFNLDVYSNSYFDIALDFNLSRLLVRISDFYIAIEQRNYKMILNSYDDLYQLFSNIFALNLPLELRQALEQVKEQRNTYGYNIFSKMWWQPNKVGIKRLRAVMIQHRNIGHDWQFTQQQKDLLKEYYDANKLLIDCLNSSNLSPEIRNEIEETLLLPTEMLSNKER